MKLHTLLLVAILPFANTLLAQEDSEKLMFGLKVGGNLSNVYDSQDAAFEADAKLGFCGGAFLSIPIVNFIGIQPEFLFSQKGFQGYGTLFGSTYSFTRTTNYFDIPVFLAIKPAEFVTFLVGPQYSFLLSKRDTYSSGTFTNSQQTEFNNENIRRNTICVTGGVDFNIKKCVLGMRIGADLFNNTGDGTSTTPRYKNVWYQMTIGFRI